MTRRIDEFIEIGYEEEYLLYIYFFDLILTLIRPLSHAELLEGFLSLVDLTRGPHAFTVHPVVCSVRTVGKPQTP